MTEQQKLQQQSAELRAQHNARKQAARRKNDPRRIKDNEARRQRLADPEYRAEHNHKMRENYKKRLQNPEKRKSVRLRRLQHNRKYWYKLAPAEYDALLVRQKGVCAICLQPETTRRNGILCSLAVDHDHATGRVRGLLCQRCNLAIGLFKDGPDICFRASEYLKCTR